MLLDTLFFDIQYTILKRKGVGSMSNEELVIQIKAGVRVAENKRAIWLFMTQ